VLVLTPLYNHIFNELVVQLSYNLLYTYVLSRSLCPFSSISFVFLKFTLSGREEESVDDADGGWRRAERRERREGEGEGERRER